MAWPNHGEAAAGERTVASAPGWFCSTALARLEPQSSSACLHPTRATPAHRNDPVASICYFATYHSSDPVPRTAGTLTSRLSRAIGSQCAFSHRSASHDQALWHPSHFCYLARVNGGVIPHFSAISFRLLGYLRRSERHLVTFFPAFPLLLPLWLSLLLILSFRTGSLSRSEQLSFLCSDLALQHSRCASRGSGNAW